MFWLCNFPALNVKFNLKKTIKVKRGYQRQALNEKWLTAPPFAF